MLIFLAVIALDAFVLMCAVGWLSDKEQPEIYKSGFAAFSISLLGAFGMGYVAALIPGILGWCVAIVALGLIAGIVVWICFDMMPKHALGAGGIFLAYKMLSVLPFVLMAPGN